MDTCLSTIVIVHQKFPIFCILESRKSEIRKSPVLHITNINIK